MIRKAIGKDLYNISKLWERLVLDARPEFKPRRDIWEQMAMQLLSTNNYTILVAEVNGEIVGFIDGFIFMEPSTGKVHGIGQHFYVLPGHRKMFIGAELYREIVSLAVEKDAEVLEFFCFPEDLPFWRRHGYSPARVMVRANV